MKNIKRGLEKGVVMAGVTVLILLALVIIIFGIFLLIFSTSNILSPSLQEAVLITGIIGVVIILAGLKLIQLTIEMGREAFQDIENPNIEFL